VTAKLAASFRSHAMIVLLVAAALVALAGCTGMVSAWSGLVALASAALVLLGGCRAPTSDARIRPEPRSVASQHGPRGARAHTKPAAAAVAPPSIASLAADQPAPPPERARERPRRHATPRAHVARHTGEVPVVQQGAAAPASVAEETPFRPMSRAYPHWTGVAERPRVRIAPAAAPPVASTAQAAPPAQVATPSAP